MAPMYNFINRFNIVRQIPIFSKLNWIEQQRIARKSSVQEYKKGDIIIKEGTPPDYFYCLVSGRLQSFAVTKEGKKDNIDFLHRGMHFGIISVLTGENHSISFEALNDSVVLQIPKDDFQNILKSIPQLGIEFSQSLSQRIRSKRKGIKTIFESSIVSIYSPVEGTGSSTYAVNLAISLEKETKKKVLYVSIKTEEQDKEDHKEKVGIKAATPTWNSKPVHLKDVIGDHDQILASIIKDDLALDLLHVVIDPKDQDASKQIAPFVSALVGDYHYVVVDLPNKMDEVALETLTQSDLVHLMTTDRRSDLDLIRRVIDRLESSLKDQFRVEKIKIVIRAAHDKVYLSFEEINSFIDYHVYAKLPNVVVEDLTVKVKSDHLVLTRASIKSEYTKAVTRIAREIGEVRVAVVLGGGAALGVAHVGVIKVLEEENIPVDVVIGSSMGALIGAMWTVGNNTRQLELIAREFEKGIAMIKLADPPLFPISGLLRGRAIRRWLKKHLGNKTFYNVEIPFKVVAYDLIRREELVIDGGSLVEGVSRSIAIPGVIKPILEGDQVIIDGGVLNPLPTNVPAALGIKKIIAVNVLQTPEDCSEGFDIHKHKLKEKASVPFFKNPFHFLMFRVTRAVGKLFTPNISDIIVRTLQASEHVIAEQSAQQADVVIHPDLVGIDWYELFKVDELINAGEKATRDLIPEIKKLVEE